MKHALKFQLFKLSMLLISLLMLQPEEAQATHFRYGNVTWERVAGNPYQIRFRITQAWRRSFYGNPNVGATVNTGSFNTGAGFQSILLNVTSVNTTEDWFYGEYTFVKTYASVNTNYNASFTGCCRISTLSNNSDDAYTVSTIVTVGNNNDAPVSTVPPFISLPVNTSAATYQIPATDPNGDAMTFSLVPNNQFGSGTVQPTGLSVSSTGLITFNTVGRAIGSLWNTAIYATDSKGARIQLDLMIRVTAPSTPPVFDYTVTPANNAGYVIQPGQTLSFSVKASDVDPNSSVALSAVGLPVGATFSPANGNPVTQSFSWTPAISSVGTYQVNFVAQDNAGVQSNTIVNIAVSLKPNFVAPSLGNGSVLCYKPGDTISQTYTASDVDTADDVILSLASSIQTGMSFSPSLPTAAANPVSTNFTWLTSSANWGINMVIVRATDSYTETKDDTVYYIVNTPPAFATTQGNTSVIAGQAFSYTFSGTDADIAQGDAISLSHTNIPSWMSITDNGNGTWTLSGTPVIADSGTYTVTLQLEDETNHFNGTHCGDATQIFDVTVIPCDITTSTSVTNVLCHGASTGAIDLAVNNATSPVSYTWSNSATTEDLNGVGAGIYSVSIVDANGCTAADTAEITEPATAVSGSISVSPSPTIAGHAANTIYLGYGAQSVTLTATANGGTPGYSYSWSNGDNTTSTTVSPASTTVYTVTITDANGCTYSQSQTIKVIDARCGNNNNKVLVCHIPPGNNSNPQTICVSANAVATHLAHGCYVGPCGSAKGGRNNGDEDGNISLQEITEEGVWNIYPNPSNGTFILELPSKDETRIIVTNIQGQVVYKQEVSNTSKLTIELGNAAKGIYLVQVVSGHDTFQTKLTIQ
ncbi:MAG TPA: putative Ig domain-containing protein [Flavipsychrobacter sp.]